MEELGISWLGKTLRESVCYCKRYRGRYLGTTAVKDDDSELLGQRENASSRLERE